MTKIVITKGSWGDYNCVIEHDQGTFVLTEDVKPTGVNLDREELLLAALARLGIEVETHVHWYVNGERTDKVISNFL